MVETLTKAKTKKSATRSSTKLTAVALVSSKPKRKSRMAQSDVQETEAVSGSALAAGSDQTTTAKPTKRPSKRRSKATPATTFSNTDVEAAFVHFCQLHSPELKTPETLTAQTRKLIAQSIDLISSPEFELSDADVTILGSTFLGTEALPPAKSPAKAPDLPAHLARLCEAKLLSPEEEKSIFARMNFLKFKANQLKQTLDLESPDSWTVRRIETLLKAADWYRDRMVKANMRLVISIVKKFVNPQNAFDDLLSDGIIALLRAVDKFDVALGFRFSTYATQVVRRNTYRRVMEKQAERLKVTASVHDAGIDVSDELRTPTMSEGRWHDLRSKLSLMLDHLDRREKLIIRARFSLGGHRRVQTLQRLADVLGVSKERIRQLEKRALDKLRGMADTEPLPESDY